MLKSSVVADHSVYLQLSVDVLARQKAYRALFEGHVADDALEVMRDSLTANYPVGNDRYKERIIKELGRSIGQAKRGRPERKKGHDG